MVIQPLLTRLIKPNFCFYTLTLVLNSLQPGADEYENATLILWRYFYRLNYFCYTFSFVKERQFRSSDTVSSVSFLWLLMALPSESHSWEIRSKKNRSMKTPWQEYSGVACSNSSAPDATKKVTIDSRPAVSTLLSSVFITGDLELLYDSLHTLTNQHLFLLIRCRYYGSKVRGRT